MGRPRKNPEEKVTPKRTRKPRVKKLKDLYLDEASSPKEAENRRNQLKALIILGKERGYLTHAEINDHLPDEISETDQVDEIISIIHDMGIRTYDEAPDAENLLMDDAPAPVTDEEAAEEAVSGTGLKMEQELEAIPRMENGVAILDTKPNSFKPQQTFKNVTMLTEAASHHGDDAAGVSFDGQPRVKQRPMNKKEMDDRNGVWKPSNG